MLGIITCSVRHTVPYFLATVKSDNVRQVCRALNATTSYTTCYCNFCLEPTDTHSRRMSTVEVSCMQTEITSITVKALQQLAEIQKLWSLHLLVALSKISKQLYVFVISVFLVMWAGSALVVIWTASLVSNKNRMLRLASHNAFAKDVMKNAGGLAKVDRKSVV